MMTNIKRFAICLLRIHVEDTATEQDVVDEMKGAVSTFNETTPFKQDFLILEDVVPKN